VKLQDIKANTEKLVYSLKQTESALLRLTFKDLVRKFFTSLRCPSPHHSAKATHLTCIDVEAVANCPWLTHLNI